MEISVSTPLKSFLAVLATDLDRLAEYLQDRDRVMEEAGLSPEDIAALKSGDPSRLEARFDFDESCLTTVRVKVIEPSPRFPTFTHAPKIDPSCLIQTVANINVVDSSTAIPTFTHHVIVETVAREASAQASAAPKATDHEDRPRTVPPPIR
jgi:hypothetical protein